MKKNFFVFCIVFILSATSSSAEELWKYEILSNSLNIREQPTQDAKVLGKFNRGDTFIAEVQRTSWIKLQYKGKNAWVYGKYVKYKQSVRAPRPDGGTIVIIPEKYSGQIIELIDNYVDWLNWKYWVGVFIAIGLCYVLVKLSNNIDEFLGDFTGRGYMDEMGTFKKIGIGGFLLGLAYVFWQESIQEFVLKGYLKYYPSGQGFLAWCVWLLLLACALILLHKFYQTIKYFRFLSIFRIVYFNLIALIVFATMFVFAIGFTYISIFIFIGLALVIPGGSDVGPGYSKGSVSSSSSSNEGGESFMQHQERKKREEEESARRYLNDSSNPDFWEIMD